MWCGFPTQYGEMSKSLDVGLEEGENSAELCDEDVAAVFEGWIWSKGAE